MKQLHVTANIIFNNTPIMHANIGFQKWKQYIKILQTASVILRDRYLVDFLCKKFLKKNLVDAVFTFN